MIFESHSVDVLRKLLDKIKMELILCDSIFLKEKR